LSPVPLYTASPPDAALDTALSHALLRRAVTGEEALRLWTPPAAMSFGKLDLLSPASERAIAVARSGGLTPVRRLAGGRAAPIGPTTVCVGWACPGSEIADVQRRYETMAAALVCGLGQLGIEGGPGELPGEWCPGSWSILVGQGKVAGLAQRVVRGGAWAEAVVVVSGSTALRSTLDKVQRALGVAWDPSTLSALADAQPGLTVARAAQALCSELGSRFDALPGTLAEATWIEAKSLREQHAL